MRKTFLMLTLIIIGAAAFAQAPEKVQETFKAKYPDVMNATWTTEDGNYVATYSDKNGMENTVVFDDDSRIVRSETQMDSKDYPASVKEYYMKKYPDEKDYHVYSMTDKDGMTNYYVVSEHRGMRYYFDKTGNFLKEEKNKVKSEVKEHHD